MHRLPLVCLVISLAACDVAGVVTGPPEAPDGPVSRRLSVSLSVGDGQASVIGMRPVLDPLITRPQPGARVLDYELVGDDGQVLAAGHVSDPRQVAAEWMEAGSFRHAVAQRARSLVHLDLPALDGEVVLRDDTGAVVASVFVAGGSPAPQALGGDALAGLGPAQLISGGGDRATGLDILMLPDGYTAGELAAFQADAAHHVDVLFADLDYAAYRDRINVWRLDVPSNESGIDEGGVARDTAFDTGRSDTIERLVYFLTAEGQAAAEELGRQNGAEQVVVISNTDGYGGSGGATAVVARGSPEVSGHEIGHSMLALADEYDYGSDAACSSGSTGPNVSASADRAQIPWAALIAADTPLPTPADAAAGVVGAYEGAGYCTTGRFRPQHDCLMRTLGVGMCAVCRGALDATMASLGGGGGGDPGGEDPGAGDPGAGDPGGGVACDSGYTCGDHGYAPDQCYEGWQCDAAGACLSYVGECVADPGAGGGGACESGYTCGDYGYAPDQCYEGWQCDPVGECLLYTGGC
ncbi:MAG TPA: M64 family metallopeptidase [Kofleriaceae bacterium]|nr:M64 family metallopeptidase [Kofleriaceae bacterium]